MGDKLASANRREDSLIKEAKEAGLKIPKSIDNGKWDKNDERLLERLIKQDTTILVAKDGVVRDLSNKDDNRHTPLADKSADYAVRAAGFGIGTLGREGQVKYHKKDVNGWLHYQVTDDKGEKDKNWVYVSPIQSDGTRQVLVYKEGASVDEKNRYWDKPKIIKVPR
jgi:hypothetical protein